MCGNILTIGCVLEAGVGWMGSLIAQHLHLSSLWLQNGFVLTAGAGAAVALAAYLVGQSKATEAKTAVEEVRFL